MTHNLTAWSDSLMCEAYRRMFRSTPGSTINEWDGLLACVGPSPSPVIVNTGFRLTERLAPDVAVAALQEHFRARRHGFSLVVAEHEGPELAEAADAAGLTSFVTLSGMLLAEPVHQPAEPTGFRTHRVRDATDLAGYREVISETFAPQAGALYDDLASLSGRDRAGWLVEHDGQPCAAGSVLLIGEAAVITTLGTREGFRRRGLGEYVTRLACADAFASGARLVTLQSSPEAVPLYERVGFRSVTSYALYGEQHTD